MECLGALPALLQVLAVSGRRVLSDECVQRLLHRSGLAGADVVHRAKGLLPEALDLERCEHLRRAGRKVETHRCEEGGRRGMGRPGERP